MKITVNKKEYELEDNIALSKVIVGLPSVPQTGIAIAVNGDVIPSSEWDGKIIVNGDKITIIKAFYGG